MAALQRKFSTRGQAKFQMVGARRGAGASAPAGADVEKAAAAEFEEVSRPPSCMKLPFNNCARSGLFQFRSSGATVDRDSLQLVLGQRRRRDGRAGWIGRQCREYAIGLPIVAVNPDPQRIDGVLLPFRTDQARAAVRSVCRARPASGR